MQTERLDARQRLKRARDLNLIRHYPAFEVTSLRVFPLRPSGALAASSLAGIK